MAIDRISVERFRFLQGFENSVSLGLLLRSQRNTLFFEIGRIMTVFKITQLIIQSLAQEQAQKEATKRNEIIPTRSLTVIPEYTIT